MLHIVLYHPEIPPNTGNIARLCAGTGTKLHLIEPLGFSLDESRLRRAGLDYWPHVDLTVWPDLASYLADDGKGRRLVATSARGGEAVHRFAFTPYDSLLFGPESTGLPPEVKAMASGRLRIPTKNCIRSLNLSTSAGIILYAALADLGALDVWQA
ncbi:MAG: tRNA (cytidine(34)-2'-O)-methyltransferase [Mailhella sp.]|nr:tRNA (cytidine(34)-2'-O)-methyltransferase [Mailhella sp.]